MNPDYIMLVSGDGSVRVTDDLPDAVNTLFAAPGTRAFAFSGFEIELADQEEEEQ